MASKVEELITRFKVDDKYSAAVTKITAKTRDLQSALGPGTGVSFDGLVSGLKLAISELDSATPIIQEVVAIIKSLAIAAGAAGVALFGLGLFAMHSAADMEALRLGLKAYAETQAEFEKNLRRLKEVARLPGLGFEEAIQGSTRLQAAGFNARLAERAMLGFGNALAAVGGGKEELDGVILALTQIATKSTVSAEEINQIAERVPQIRRLMLEAFGTANTESLAKMGIGSQEFILKIIDALENLTKTTGGAKTTFENFGDTFKRIVAQVGDVLNKVFLPPLERIVSFFDYLEEIQVFKGITEGMTSFLGDLKVFEDAIINISAIIVAGLEQIPKFIDLITRTLQRNIAQIMKFVDQIIDLINSVIQSYVEFTRGKFARFLGIKPASAARIEKPKFTLGPDLQGDWMDFVGSLGGRAKELVEGFKNWKPSNEVANDKSKGGFTFSADDNLSQIAKATRETALNTSSMRELTDMILGGSGRIKVDRTVLRGMKTGSRRARQVIEDFGNLFYHEGQSSMINGFIAFQRGS
jgi:tape measure domain-containing protein